MKMTHFFPDDVWVLVKEFLIYGMDAVVAGYIRRDQKKYFGQLDLQFGFRIYEQFVKKERSWLFERMLYYYNQSHEMTARKVEQMITVHRDWEDTDYDWAEHDCCQLYEYRNVLVRRVINKFLDVFVLEN